MTNIGAAFTVRFLRNGDSITITRDIIKSSGEGAALFQMVDVTSGAVAPDWSKAENQPIIRLTLHSAAGYPISVSSCTWAYNGQNLSFVYNGTNWVNEGGSYAGVFQARINSDGCPELKITNNLASASAISNRQINYAVDYVSAAHHETIEGSVDVLIQQAGANSHMLQITTERVELSGDKGQATYQTVLRIEAYYGTSKVTIGSGGYTTKWYKDGTEDSNYIANSDGKTSLTVTRDDIDGGSIFVCKLILNGNAVAQDQQRINDISDEYQIVATPSSTSANFVSLDGNAVYTLKVTKNGIEDKSAWKYVWNIFNLWGKVTKTGSGNTITITADDCKGNNDSEYSDVDVAVSASLE